MPLIPYPNVPNYPGVPDVPRIEPGAPEISLSLVQAGIALSTGFQNNVWGVFTYPEGVPLYSPSSGATLSTFSVSYVRQMQISDYPIEANATGQGAAFASFNKVWQPANPVVTLAVSGPDADLSGFLAALDAACESTDLYTVSTPDATYAGYSIESYSYQRAPQRGATMLTVEISLKEIIQVAPAYTAINSPKAPSAASPTNNGIVQPLTPGASALSSAPSWIHEFVRGY